MLAITDEEFTTSHQALNERILKFGSTRRGKSCFGSELRDRLSMSSASSLKAINNNVRIRFSAELAAQVSGALRDQDEGDVAFITLIQREHAMPIEMAQEFDIDACKTSMKETLRDCAFVGTVEAAYYYNAPFAADKGRYVSWHSHALVWGTPTREIARRIKEFNSAHVAFVPGYAAGHYKSLNNETAVIYSRYMSKNIVKECTAYPKKEEVLDTNTGELIPTITGRWKNRKRDIRNSSFIRAATAMGDRTIEKITFGGGLGKNVRKTALINTKRVIEEEELKRKASLAMLLFGNNH